MIRRRFLSTALLLISAADILSLPGMADPPVGASLPAAAPLAAPARRASIAGDFGRLPLSFEPNRGQTDSKVRFLSHTGDSTLFLTPSEAIFSTTVKSFPRPQQSLLPRRGRDAQPKSKQFALRMQMIGADPKASALTQQPLSGRVNYFLGKDPGQWHAGVPTFGRVGFHGVYPGIDLVYYGNQQHLEYDFLVAPHADPKQIRMQFAGAQRVRVDAAGNLIVRAQGRELTWKKPTVYQEDTAGKHAIAAHFQLNRLSKGQSSVRFALGHYDPARPLVIDPVLLYSTYLGGGSTESGNSIAVDSSGNAYVTGSTASGTFPTTTGAFQRTKQTTTVGFVTKFNAAGTALIYSTFLGGSGPNGDQPYSIAIDGNGDAYIAGFTSSIDFPTTPGALQTVNNAHSSGTFNGFVTKLDPTGSALIYSTYLGGTGRYGDQAHTIAIDSSGNAYVAGSAHSSDFPTTAGAFQRVNKESASGYNAFVAKLNSTGTALIYSTLLGGSGLNGDAATGIAIDSSGNAYVAGVTGSSDFPTTPGAFQTVSVVKYSAAVNAFVTKLNPTGTALVYSTFLGGSKDGGDAANGLAIDSAGNAYVTGYATSLDFPTTPGAFQRVNRAQSGYYNVFVTKLNPSGDRLIYSTFLGGSGAAIDQGLGIAIDSNGNAYVTGEATSPDFPTTIGALQRIKTTKATIYSGFVTELSATGAALVYSTYLRGSGNSAIPYGGVNGDFGIGITLDTTKNAYIVGYTYSPDFPVTTGAFQSTNRAAASSGANAFVTKMALNPIFPDFNNDGNTDLLIQNSTSNVIASWFMNGSQWISGAYFSLTPPSDYGLVGVGDFSGNGSTTLVLQSRTTNQVAFWYTSGANNAVIPGGNFVNATPAAGWKVVGVGDFNGDGKSDLLFQNQTTNQVAVWFMNGYLYQGGVLLPFTPPAGWTVAGVGDLNGDGFPDIVFQNQTSRQIALWYMNGTTYAGGIVMPNVPGAGWKVVGVGDYNGDGSADLLLQNQTSNQAMVWYLNAGVFQSSADLSLNPPVGWKIVGPR